MLSFVSSDWFTTRDKHRRCLSDFNPSEISSNVDVRKKSHGLILLLLFAFLFPPVTLRTGKTQETHNQLLHKADRSSMRLFFDYLKHLLKNIVSSVSEQPPQKLDLLT